MQNDIRKSEIKKYEPLWNEWIIGDIIGEGSYGTVYEVHSKKSKKKAAVKFISVPKNKEELKDIENESEEYSTTVNDIIDNRKEKYVEEANLLKSLKESKHVVRYQSHSVETKKISNKTFGKKDSGSGAYGWSIFIRMELLLSLDKYIKKNGLRLGEVIKLGIDLCSALEDCQEKGIVHRDVKKANIFVGEEGYKLGDFGISKVQFVSKTASKEVGTYDYMAPEIRMHSKFGFNSDIYSLGMVMYRLLNNDKFPFVPTDGTDTIDTHMEAQQKRESGIPFPAPLFSDKADDNGKLTEIILKACAFDRFKRYQNASDMKRDLVKLNEIATNKEMLVLKPKEIVAIDLSSDETIWELPPGKRPVKKKRSKGRIAVYAVLIIAAIVFGCKAFAPAEVKDLTGIPIDNASISMAVGDAMDLDPVIVPKEVKDVIEFSSSDTEVATIDEDGLIEAKSEGETQITVKCRNFKKTLNLSVSPQIVPVMDIEGVPESKELEVNKSFNIGCKALPENATDKTITYLSSDASIATVDENGQVKALKSGKTTIEVKSGDVVKWMVLTVKEKTKDKKTKDKITDTNDTTNTDSGKKSYYPHVENSSDGSPSDGSSGGTSSDDSTSTPREGDLTGAAWPK